MPQPAPCPLNAIRYTLSAVIMSPTMSTALSTPVSFVLVDGSNRSTGTIDHSPFTVGRLPENDLVLAHPYVSRRHADILIEAISSSWWIRAAATAPSSTASPLPPASRSPPTTPSTSAPSTAPLSTSAPSKPTTPPPSAPSSTRCPSGAGNPLDKLRWFFESARKLNTSDAVDQILTALLDTTLQLTQVERGYVFLANEAGEMHLAVGRSDKGEELTDESTLSHGAMRQAMNSDEFILTDTLSADPETRSASIVAHSIRSVICIPLRKRRPGSSQRASRSSRPPLPRQPPQSRPPHRHRQRSPAHHRHRRRRSH